METQVMTLGYSAQEPVLFVDDSPIEINHHLNILGVHIASKLSFKDHISASLKKVYAKIGVLWSLKKLVPTDVVLIKYKAHILLYLEYRGPLL